MRKTRNALFLVLAGGLVGACETRTDAEVEPGTLPAEEPADAATQPMTVSSAQFEATPDAEGLTIFGTAELLRRGDQVGMQDGLDLRVVLAGLSEGDHGWHIHQGTCAEPGAVVIPLTDTRGMDGIAGALGAGSDGRVEETVTLDREHLARLDHTQSYSVNVHLRSGVDHGAAIACANLDLQSAWAPSTPGAVPPADAGTAAPGSPDGAAGSTGSRN